MTWTEDEWDRIRERIKPILKYNWVRDRKTLYEEIDKIIDWEED